MCHGSASAAFPEPKVTGHIKGEVPALRFGTSRDGKARVAVLPDIYGANDFYQGFSQYIAGQGDCEALLVDPFAKFGSLQEVTREAAFKRRDMLNDSAFMEALSRFLQEYAVTGVVGFCIGGLFVFDLARRGFAGDLVAFYPFPQGLPNTSPVPVPWTYLHEIQTPVSVLIGSDDHLLGDKNLWRLQETARANPSLDLNVYQGAGHGFLQALDSDDLASKTMAKNALQVCESRLFG